VCVCVCVSVCVCVFVSDSEQPRHRHTAWKKYKRQRQKETEREKERELKIFSYIRHIHTNAMNIFKTFMYANNLFVLASFSDVVLSVWLGMHRCS